MNKSSANVAAAIFLAASLLSGEVARSVPRAEAAEGTFRTAPAASATGRSQLINAKFAGFAERLTAALGRIEQHFQRAGRLVAAFEDRRVDMTTPKTLQKSAEDAIAAAKETLASLPINPDPKITNFKNLVEPIRRATEQVREAHLAVVQVIRSIRASYRTI